MWFSWNKWNLLVTAGTIRKHGIDPEEEIMEWKLPESHSIFDHHFLEGVFSTALPTPRGWKGNFSREGWRDHSPLFVQKDTLNQEAEQLQGVDPHLDHPGAGLQGIWYHICCWQRKGALTWKRETNPLTTHRWLPEQGTARVPALVHLSPLVILSCSCSFPLSPAVSSS